MLTTLQYEPEKASKQEDNAPSEQAEDSKETENKIKAGKKEGSKLSKEHAEAQNNSN